MLGGARVRLNGWQQAAVSVGSAFGALLDPRRADLLAALGETTGKPAFERVLELRRNRNIRPRSQDLFKMFVEYVICSIFPMEPKTRYALVWDYDGINQNGSLNWLRFFLSWSSGRSMQFSTQFSSWVIRKQPLCVANTKAVLLERPRVISANVGHAWNLPENTFGAAYAKFMGSRNFSPDDRPPVRFMDTEELAYVAMRAREVHDFWHTLFGLPTNLMGESALKVIEFQQMQLPMCFMSVIGGSARFNPKQRSLFFQHYFPWAIRAGMNCSDLMCLYYERHFDEDLDTVHRKWGIVPVPPLPTRSG